MSACRLNIPVKTDSRYKILAYLEKWVHPAITDSSAISGHDFAFSLAFLYYISE